MPKAKIDPAKLVEMIKNDPFVSNATLATMLNVSEAAVSKRMGDLIHQRAIGRFVNQESGQVNFTERVIVFLKVEVQALKSEKLQYQNDDQFEDFLSTKLLKVEEFSRFEDRISIESVDSVTGAHGDVLITVRAKEARDWHEFVIALRTLPGVAGTETLQVFRSKPTLKSTAVPML